MEQELEQGHSQTGRNMEPDKKRTEKWERMRRPSHENSRNLNLI